MIDGNNNFTCSCWRAAEIWDWLEHSLKTFIHLQKGPQRIRCTVKELIAHEKREIKTLKWTQVYEQPACVKTLCLKQALNMCCLGVLNAEEVQYDIHGDRKTDLTNKILPNPLWFEGFRVV